MLQTMHSKMSGNICKARVLNEDNVYTIGDTDFTATSPCSATTTKSILNENVRTPICEDCAKKRKKGVWHGWFDDTMNHESTFIHSKRFYDTLMVAYTNEYPQCLTPIAPGTLYAWFQKNLAEGERDELEAELVVLKEKLGEGNKPETMIFNDFLKLVKQKMEIIKRLKS